MVAFGGGFVLSPSVVIYFDFLPFLFVSFLCGDGDGDDCDLVRHK